MWKSLQNIILFLLFLLLSPFLLLMAFGLLLLDIVLALTGSSNKRGEKGEASDGVKMSLSGKRTRSVIRGEKVLVIQSAEPDLMLKILDGLKNVPLFHHPYYTIFCRDYPEILRHFVGHPMVHRVIPHARSRGWLKHLANIRREHYHTVVVSFTGDPSYWKIKCFAFLTGARRKLIFDQNNNCYFLSWPAWYGLMERDLVLSGIFQSYLWKWNRPLQWLAERYQSVRMHSPAKDAAGRQGLRFKQANSGGEESESRLSAMLRHDPLRRPNLSQTKITVTALSEIALHSFLSSRARFQLPVCEEPKISVILVLYNRAELTLQCLRTLAENDGEDLEIIIADNASSDATAELLGRLDGATIIRNSENLHFLTAANNAAKRARGRYILFLNNDAQVLPGSIRAALQTIESSENVGAVGGKLILPDGSLQEAGSIIWSDGSCLGYGRGDNPFAPMYTFRRDVDYCSGAFLLTRRDTFLNMGGFEEAYKPFYYEETDLCLRLWERGMRVVYEPDAAILHYEYASSSSSGQALEFHERNQHIFFRRHQERLRHHFEPKSTNILKARSALGHDNRVLFIDDRVPHAFLGSGFPRSNAILAALVKFRSFVTFYPTAVIDEKWDDAYLDIPREVEVMLGQGPAQLEQFLAERAGFYDTILISRPHNMQYFRPIFRAHEDWFADARIIFDAEALFSSRDIARHQVLGRELSGQDSERLTKNEIELADIADSVISVSSAERDVFVRYGAAEVHVLGHAMAILPTPRKFHDRNGFLFVGNILDEASPNGDAVLWFAREILPIIRKRLNSALFIVAGTNGLGIGPSESYAGLCMLGRVDDLSSIYDEARVFVAPTRFAAGIPHKIHEAAARGMPVIATSLLARQLGWRDDEHLLVADEPVQFADQCVRLYSHPELWQRIRVAALERVRKDCSPELFENTLRAILDESKPGY
jgi:GT2 family glycosyltransferase